MTVQQSIRATPEDSTPIEDEVRLELQKMLASKDFDSSSRNRRFLTFVVEETLAGRSDRIKAYNVALAVFDRSSDFDPLTDPIVRIEASRLRRSIEHYYLTGGLADRVRIAMPKGSYVTTFAYADPDGPGLPVAEPITPIDVEEPAAEDVAATVVPVIEPRKPIWSRIGLIGMAALVFAVVAAVSTTLAFAPSQIQPESAAAHEPAILVLPFDYVGPEVGQAGMARAFTTEIIVNLTQSRSLAVFGTEPVINAEQSPAIGDRLQVLRLGRSILKCRDGHCPAIRRQYRPGGMVVAHPATGRRFRTHGNTIGDRQGSRCGTLAKPRASPRRIEAQIAAARANGVGVRASSSWSDQVRP